MIVDSVVGARGIGDRVLLYTRIVLLVLLSLGTFAVNVNGDPTPRTLDDLYADLRAGRVSTIVMDRAWPGYGELTWSEGPLSWYRAFGYIKPEVWDPVTTRLDEERLESVRREYLDKIDAAARIGGRPVTVTDRLGAMGSLWAYVELQRLWGPLAPLGPVALAIAFLLMLGLPQRRYATRWGWFWLFLRGGAVAYVLLEPYPIWRRPHEVLPERRPLDGWQALILAIALTFLLVFIPL